MDTQEQILDVLQKIERNQRLLVKVVLSGRALSLPYSQAKELTPEQLADLGSKSDDSKSYTVIAASGGKS
jgi:DNA polymerase III psi subunit